MNKNMKYLFLLTTLVILLVGLTALSAADVSDNSTIQQDTITTPSSSINTVEKVQTDNKVQNTVKDNKASVDKKTVKKETKKIKQETKTETVTDYESLKQTWNNIETNGTSDTEYTINVKNGEYLFDEALSLKDTNTTHVNIIGEDKNKTIFNGQNKTGLFCFNNTCLNVTFKNISFINGNTRSVMDSIYITSKNNVSIDNCLFDHNVRAIATLCNTTIINTSFMHSYEWAVRYSASLTLFNCSFINNTSPIGQSGAALVTGGYNGTLNATNCDFIDNQAAAGAVIYVGNGISGRTDHYFYNCLFRNTTRNCNIDDDYLVFDSWLPKIVGFENCYFDGLVNPKKAYPPTCVANNIIVLANNKPQGSVFTQKDKSLTLRAITNGVYNNYNVKSIGTGFSIPITTTGNYINTSNLVLSSANNYTVRISLTGLPNNFEDFRVQADGVNVSTIRCKKTDVTFNPVTVKTGSVVTFNATFKDDGYFIEKGNVAFKINGKTIGHSSVKFGKASLTYKLPLYSAKNYTLNVVYGGNNKYNEARVNTTLTLLKQNTRSVITTGNAVANSRMSINVRTVGEDNQTVVGGKVAVKVNRKTVKVVNNTGNVTVEFNVPKSWKNRNITVQTAFSGSSVYSGCRSEVGVHVKQSRNNIKTNSLKHETVQNYYVSSINGSDSNSGSMNSPFKTIRKAISTINSTKNPSNIYLTGTFKGEGNTNLTVPGDLYINFIGLNGATIDGEANYTIKTKLEPGEFYWNSRPEWMPYLNGSGNWAMNITKGQGLITISNMTITKCWNPGGSSILAYRTATVDNYGNLRVDNVNFTYNCGGVGASIRNNINANLTVTNSLFDANRKSSSTGNFGAGVYNAGNTTIINSTFQNNWARWGTITNDGVMKVLNSTIRDNIGYDGGSTYKAGSGISINTGSADFFYIHGINGLSTVIDGCIFINNDQLDISAGKGQLNLTNNIFNKSTGVSIPESESNDEKGLNLTLHYIISNNTFINSVGSSIYTSLSSSVKKIITLVLEGKYDYTIENNRVFNLTGTQSKALEVSAGHVIIRNNTFTRTIEINSENNIITGNNITTIQDMYAINLGLSKNNIIENNYLLTNGYRGDDAVNYTSTRNIIENNTPIVSSIKIDDNIYTRYFDKNGNLLPAYRNVEQIEVRGTLTNKNIIINKTASLTQINNKFTSYNITITTIGNAKAEIKGLNIINDKEAILIINSDNNDIQRNNFKTNNQYTIQVTGKNNKITENELIADMLVGDNSIQTTPDNNITDNTPTYTNYILSQDTYNNYFNNDGRVKQDEDIHFIVNGTITNKNFILDNNHTITITNYNNAQLLNTTITTLGNTTLNLTGITIKNANNKPAIELNTPENYINYNNIQTNTNAINIINTTNLELNYNNITANSTRNVTAISIKDSHKIWKSQADDSDPIQITNNKILTIGPETQINNDKLVGTQSIEVLNTLDIVISNNFITTKCNNNLLNGTIYSINIINNNISDDEYVYSYARHFDRVSYNTINTYGNNQAIGVKYVQRFIRFEHNSIQTNASEAVGLEIINSTNGIYRTTYGITSNDIITTGLNGYGIKIIESKTLRLSGTFISNATNITGTHVNNSEDITISYGTYQLTGNYTRAITVTQSKEIEIKSTTINTNSRENTSPIELINTTETNMHNNIIITNTPYTIQVDENSIDNSITNNSLYADILFADNSVNTKNENNRIVGNNPAIDVNYYLSDKTYNQYFNNNGTLKDEIPEGLTIQQTGTLTNKTLNITRPINLIAEEVPLTNTTIIISSNNTNITGITLQGQDNKSKIIVNGNNNNISITAITIDNIRSMNLKPIIINGNNNIITIKDNSLRITSDSTLNSNLTLITVNGDKNTINQTQATYIYNINALTVLLLNKSNNNQIKIPQLTLSNINYANIITINNSNNNTIRSSMSPSGTIDKYIGLILDNSSYNQITGSMSTNSNNTTVIITKNNSNYNNLESIQAINSKGITQTPIIIENSHYNNITDSEFQFNEFQGHAILINEGVGNIIEYNYIKTLSLDGDLAVIQTNKNETVNNIVRYNRVKRLAVKTTRFNLEGVNTAKIGDTIQITANITYRSGREYVPVPNGTVTFMVNGVEEIHDITNDTIIFNYTINNYNNGEITIKAIYNDPDEVYRYTTKTKTINIEKHETQVNLGNFTNNGITSILTALVTDINGKIIDNGTVVFRVNDEVIGTVDITNNVAVLPVSVDNYKAGVYNLTATYNGNDYYLSGNTTGLLTVNKYNATASITPVTAKAGETVTLTSIIKDISGNLVDNGIAVFKLNNKTLKDEFGQNIYAQVHNGIATINYTIPDNYSAKDYNLTVVTSSDTYKRTENTTTLTITKHDTQILLEPIHVTRSNNTHIKIEIVDENDNPITGSTKVAVKFNGKTQLHTRANNGILEFNMDLTDYKDDSYKLEVVVAGNSIYNNARTSNMIFIE